MADFGVSVKAVFPGAHATRIFTKIDQAGDGRIEKVRYYTGPDGVAVPRVKQLLGADWYWEEFRNASTGNPSDLWKSLVTQGEEPVEFAL